jgi:four helix bundle protein
LVLLALRATDEASHPRCYALFDQLRRAAVSVEANIVEGYALGSTPQFKRHLRIALGSAAEAECLVRI